MNYTEKLQRIENHLAKHPRDYQASISLLKTRSDAIEHELYMRKVYRLKRLNEVRRQLREIENGKKQQ